MDVSVNVETLRRELAEQLEQERAARDAIKRERRYDNANLPGRLRQASSRKIPDSLPHKAKVQRWVEKFWASLAKDRPMRGLFLYGAPGTGKTSIAGAILKAFLDSKVLGYFQPYVDLYDVYQADEPVIANGEVTVWQWMETCPLLVIDDFGAGHTDRFGQIGMQLFENLLRKRLADGLPTVVTSNLSPVLMDKLSARLWNVVQEACFPVEVAGVDYRAAIAKEDL